MRHRDEVKSRRDDDDDRPDADYIAFDGRLFRATINFIAPRTMERPARFPLLSTHLFRLILDVRGALGNFCGRKINGGAAAAIMT